MKLSEFVEQIARSFDLSELHDLCFKLGIEFEELPGRTRTDKARALVEYNKRRSKLDQLVNLCKTLRPYELWQFEKSWYDELDPNIVRSDNRSRRNGLILIGIGIVVITIIGLTIFYSKFANGGSSPNQVAASNPTNTSTPTPSKASTNTLTPSPTETSSLTPSKMPSNTPTLLANIPPPPTETPTLTYTINPPTAMPTHASTPTTIPSFACANGLLNYGEIITSCRSNPIDLEAIYFFSDREIENKPDYAPAYRDRSEAGYRLGNITRQAGNNTLADQYLDGAISDCIISVNLSPDWAPAYYNCGFVYWNVPNRESDTLENIIFNFEKYLELAQISEPSTPAHASYYRLGEAYRLKDGCEVALPYYQNALEYAPDEGSASNAQQRINLCTN